MGLQSSIVIIRSDNDSIIYTLHLPLSRQQSNAIEVAVLHVGEHQWERKLASSGIDRLSEI